MEEQLELPEYYLNTITGDLYVIWYKSNRPKGNSWVRIYEKVYKMLFKIFVS